MEKNKPLIPSSAVIESQVLVIRGQKVLLAQQLAALYQVETKILNQAVKRNLARFPEDFMFQLSEVDIEGSRSQFVTLNGNLLGKVQDSRSQFVTLKRGTNLKYAPYAFTEQGVAMLSSVLKSERAVAVNIEIMRAFVKLRGILNEHSELKRKIESLEKKYDSQFKVVFDAINTLMEKPAKSDDYQRTNIGFTKVKK